MNSDYLTDAEFQRRKASLAGTLAESLAHRILSLKGFHLYKPWLLQMKLEQPTIEYYDLQNELAKSARSATHRSFIDSHFEIVLCPLLHRLL